MNDNTALPWLEAGMDLLVESGPKGLTIERLCQRTGKTKGSFYHHFQNRQAFQRQLLDFWEKSHTQDLIELTGSEPASRALSALQKVARELNFDRESAFRTWARYDQETAETVLRVDRSRVAHVQRLLIQTGHDAATSQSVAWLEYALFLGLAQIGESISSEQSLEARRLFDRKVVALDELE